MSAVTAAREAGAQSAPPDSGASDRRPHVVVIGAGVSGLTAAHALLKDHTGEPAPAVTVLEASDRAGGKVRTVQLAGQPVDVGAESLLLREPAALELCAALGLDDDLLAPATMATSVYSRGRVRPMPPGILGGLPQGARSVLRSGILSPAGSIRAALDLILPPSRLDTDQSVAELVGHRLGREVLERLVDPLLGTIYAAGCEQLSLRAAAPQLEAMARAHRSLVLGIRAAKAPGGGGPPPFRTVSGGLSRLIERLCEELAGRADLRLGARVDSIAPRERGEAFQLTLRESGSGRERRLQADGLIVAAPAAASAQIFSASQAALAAELKAIPSAPATVVSLRFAAGSFQRQPAQAGILVPLGEQKLLGACTVLSAKWPQLASTGDLWLRCSVGRAGHATAAALDDAALVHAIAAEVGALLGVTGAPAASHLQRWPQALPVYTPGHLERVARIERAVAAIEGLELAGAAYHGIGVPTCIAQGRAAAERLSATLRRRA